VRELRPWLYRIARNTALNQLRVAGYDLDELMDSLSAADDPAEEVVRRAVVRQTLAAVAALPERQREALLRTAISGDGQEEVARDLGLSDTAMRQLVHRARVSVRAAATALVPMPVATWLAAGAGGAGTAATLAKAGTLVVLAGGAVSAPVLITHGPPTPRGQRAEAAGHRERARAAPGRRPEATAAPIATATATATAQRVLATAPATSRRSTERRGSGASERGRDHEQEVAEHRGGRDDDISRSGPGGGTSSGSGDDGGHHGRNRGPGGGEDDDAVVVATPTATATPEAAEAEEETEDHHGGDDGSHDGSGSGTSGKDGSGGGSSGPG
jgi:hypothetical protein